MKFHFILVCCSFFISFQISRAQIPTQSDTFPGFKEKSLEDSFKKQSEWLVNALASYDSIINVIVYKSDLELKKQTDIKYTIAIVQTLLIFQKDLGYQVIMNNLTNNPFINYSKVFDVANRNQSFPVMLAIKRAQPNQIYLLKEYIIHSDFLTKKLSDEEIKCLHELLFINDMEYGERLKSFKFKGQIKENMKAIIDLK